MKLNAELIAKKKELLAEVGRRISRFGFPAKASGQAFYKRTDFGQQIFHLSFAEYENYFDVTTDVAVRFDEVEGLVNEPNKLLSVAEKRKTATLGCELGNLRNGRRKIWEGIGRGSDIAPVADSVVAFFAEVGLPYFEKYSRMEAALTVLKEDDRESWLHSPIHAERAKRAVALAQVLCGPEEAKRVADEKRKRVRQLDSNGAAMFERFADWLNSRTSAAGALPH